MKLALVLGAIVVIGILGVIFFSADKTTSTGSATTQSQEQRTFDAVYADMQAGSPLWDVRTPAEFGAGHIKDAANVPLDTLQSGSIPAAAKDKPVYVYCRSGNRSAQAKQVLQQAGFTNVVDLGALSDVVAMGGTEVK